MIGIVGTSKGNNNSPDNRSNNIGFRCATALSCAASPRSESATFLSLRASAAPGVSCSSPWDRHKSERRQSLSGLNSQANKNIKLASCENA
jgi:hypothetical protein